MIDASNESGSSQCETDFSSKLLEMMALLSPQRKLATVFEERPRLKNLLESFHPVKSAALVAGLLTLPSLHANTHRLEILVHLLIAYASGKRKPNSQHISAWLNTELGSSMCAHFEDPLEDVFISNVTSNNGNYRIFEGTWECNDFFLQRILNLIETLPDSQDVKQLMRSVYAALKLSEEIANSRQLDRYVLGEGQAKGRLQIPSIEHLQKLRRSISFSSERLSQLGILPDDLMPFTFIPKLRTELREQSSGDSELQRRPIAYDGDSWFVLLPAAISVAIRRYVLEWMYQRGYQQSFDGHLTLEYMDFFRETPIFGASLPEGMPLPSKVICQRTVFDVTREVDAGRYLNLMAIVDGLESYLSHGFSELDTELDDFGDKIYARIESTRKHIQKEQGFRQGLTLIVSCGYGRPSALPIPKDTDDWKVEMISAPDIQVFSWMLRSSSLFLWRLVEHERFLDANKIKIANPNGLLNLYGWWSDTNYMLLDQNIPFGGEPLRLAIPTDCQLNIRKKFRQGWDIHALPLPDGRFVRVQRGTAESYFVDEDRKPQYAAIDAARAGKLLGAWEGKQSIWWLTAEHQKTSLPRDTIFQVWDALNNWLERVVPVLEKRLPKDARRVLKITLDFNGVRRESVEPIPEEQARSCIDMVSDLGSNTIKVILKDPFLGGFRNPKNVAERLMIRSLVTGFMELYSKDCDNEGIEAIVEEIVPDNNARYVHIFEASCFRDIIHSYDSPEKLFVDEADAARAKLGLGWLVQSRHEKHSFTTAAESSKFLNSVVNALWCRMKPRLRALNRLSLIEKALTHIEGVEADKKRWQRTIRAVLALRDDKASAKNTALEQIARCNAAELSLRLIVEMAISECPLDSGFLVGELDLTPLMSDVLLIFHLGGCSDAIRKHVMKPEIRIAPNGDVLTHTGFREKVTNPMGQHFESIRLDHDSKKYDKHYEPFTPVISVNDKFPGEFLTALEAEFGLTIDAIRGVRDALENLAIEKKKCVLVARREEILSFCETSKFASADSAGIFLDSFENWPRERWDKEPEGFLPKDWFPWLFGRRLSLIARPVVRLENSENPQYVISPGLIGVGVILTISRYYEGEVDNQDCRSIAMQRWVGKESHRRGHEFATEVYEAYKALGYEVLLEKEMTSLMPEKLERNYGDIDVLAWKKGESEVLAVECKNLKFAKTANEIAEQLNKFNGQTKKDGESDDLLKHIIRCELLKQKPQRVAEIVGMAGQKIKIKTVVCFSKLVPMQYVADQFPDIRFETIDDLY